MKNLIEKATVSIDALNETRDYATILDSHNLGYREVDYYYQVGEITQVQGWILHISVIQYQVSNLLEAIVPKLVVENVPFKIVRNISVAIRLLEGNFGYDQLAKIVSIYPENNEIAARLAKKLIELTLMFRGPLIPTDIHLGGSVYTRYGSFNPIIVSNATGRTDKYIYDSQGNLIMDNYCIPFQLPAGISWPFLDIIPPPLPIPNKLLLNNKYRIVSLLKGDAKGRVMKALRLKGFMLQWCVVKEGNQNMWADASGRDMSHRLAWQYELQRTLSNEISIPKAYDLFSENGNTYFVMQFIKGKLLGKKISEIYGENGHWCQLVLTEKLILLDLLLQILSMIEKMHQIGYVHRDITLNNFLLDNKDNVIMIDVELAYKLNDKTLDPAFALGSDGYMSIEQFTRKLPTLKEDIYAIGALMTSFFTGLHPLKFRPRPSENLEQNLYFFIQDTKIVKLIIQCLSDDPKNRPEISAIKKTIQNCVNDFAESKGQVFPLKLEEKLDPLTIKEIISRYLQTLNSQVNSEKIWYSNTKPNGAIIRNIQLRQSVYPGLHTGISGILYLTTLIKRASISIDTAMETIQKNYEYIQNEFLALLPNVTPGLYHGAGGVSIALVSWLKNGQTEQSDKIRAYIQRCIELPSNGLDLAYGAAGQGLAILQCAQYISDEVVKKLLSTHINTLLTSQQKDGSWLIQEIVGKRQLKITGFSNGAAGIVCFLLEYYRQYNDELAKKAAIKALRWLKKKAQKKDGLYTWKINNRSERSSRWLESGFTGIALCFIRAYEILKEPVYKQIAEKILYNHAKYLVHDNHTTGIGITGVGQVYLEAYRVFKDKEWRERADWIALTLIHTSNYSSNGSCYWDVETGSPLTVDLVVGNSGVVHFLLRNLIPDSIGFPFLPERTSTNQNNTFIQSK